MGLHPYSRGIQYGVDIVLCIDVTGSMRPILNTVKDSALSFHKRLEDVMADKGKAISQLRLKVIAFRDFAHNADDAIHQTDFLQYPNGARVFQRFISELSAQGGGDEPESGLEALALAIRSPWEQGLDRRRHVVVVFTDASAHPLGKAESMSSERYPKSIARTEDQLFEEWGYQSSESAIMENSAKRLLLFAPDVEPWQGIAANWNNTIMFPSQAGKGLGEWEMDEIIQTIVNSL
jgi:hypothetical protein